MITKVFAVCLLVALVSVPALANTTSHYGNPNAIVNYANGNDAYANFNFVNGNINGNTDVNFVNGNINGNANVNFVNGNSGLNTNVNFVNGYNNGNLTFVNMRANFTEKVNPNN